MLSKEVIEEQIHILEDQRSRLIQQLTAVEASISMLKLVVDKTDEEVIELRQKGKQP